MSWCLPSFPFGTSDAGGAWSATARAVVDSAEGRNGRVRCDILWLQDAMRRCRSKWNAKTLDGVVGMWVPAGVVMMYSKIPE